MKILQLALVPLLLAAGSLGSSAAAVAGPGDQYSQSQREKTAAVERLKQRHGDNELMRVIVGLEDQYEPVGHLGKAKRLDQQRRIDQAQAKALSRLQRGRFKERRRFRNIPFMALDVTADQLEALRAMPEVSSIEEDRLSRPSLFETTALIGAPSAWDMGYDGSGQAVVILDTGVDSSHPFFAATGKLVAEACFSSNTPDNGGTSTCPGGVTFSEAVGSGENCAIEECRHGTHVAGIAVGNDLVGPDFGVAPGADLISIQVFTEFDNPTLCGSQEPCLLSYSSDQAAAMEHVYELSQYYDIAAVNISLGGGAYTGHCDVEEFARKIGIDNLRVLEIPTVIASGNDGLSGKLQSPACISGAISVGASTADDKVASFSNYSELLSLMAPGVAVTSAVPGGGVDTFKGTSMAAPHVAGAWAVLREKKPEASIDQLLADLQETGVGIDVPGRNGPAYVFPRIDVALALNAEAPLPVPVTRGQYVPINGCRIIDTRVSGEGPAAGTEMEFYTGKSGQSLVPQGGARGGCGLPADVTAVHANIIVLPGSSSGYLRAWPSGQEEPQASIVTYAGNSAGNGVNLPVCTRAYCPHDLVFKFYGGTEGLNLVVDVFGYFVP